MTATKEAPTTGRFLRGLGWFDPSEHPDAHVSFVGAGGIGSFAAFGAAKLGIPSIRVIDFDEVDEHNYGNQMYSIHDVGTEKVAALTGLLDQGEGNIEPVVGRGEEQEYKGVVVSGLDSMEARIELWNSAIKLKPRVPLYIDGRLGGQLITLYAVKPAVYDDCKSYEATLYSDDDAEEAPCTERGVIDVGLMVGSLITRMLRLHYTGQDIPPITMINQETLMVTQGEWVE